MQIRTVDRINSGLIVLALLLAYCIPFKLFLLSYAVLGPLHYLTEIHWLKSKGFFLSKPAFRSPVLLLFAIGISLFSFAHLLKPLLPNAVYTVVYGTVSWANTLLFSSFVFVLLSKTLSQRIAVWWQLLLSLAIGFGLKLLLPTWLSYFGLFVPTLLHVYVFTILFMFYGWRKERSAFGNANLLMVILVPFCIAFLPFPTDLPVPDSSDIAILNESRFTQLHLVLAKWSTHTFSKDFVYNSVFGRKIQIFIAFAYLYHYLNWFSKTTLIGWKNTITTKSAIVIAIVWGVSLGIYWYDFAKGFMALFFLSFLHVLMEFPLNIDTMKALFKRS